VREENLTSSLCRQPAGAEAVVCPEPFGEPRVNLSKGWECWIAEALKGR